MRPGLGRGAGPKRRRAYVFQPEPNSVEIGERPETSERGKRRRLCDGPVTGGAGYVLVMAKVVFLA